MKFNPNFTYIQVAKCIKTRQVHGRVLGKLIVSHMIKESLLFYGTWRFVFMTRLLPSKDELQDSVCMVYQYVLFLADGSSNPILIILPLPFCLNIFYYYFYVSCFIQNWNDALNDVFLLHDLTWRFRSFRMWRHVVIYQRSRRHIPEDHNLHIHRLALDLRLNAFPKRVANRTGSSGKN
jgi:hypothetical protein